MRKIYALFAPLALMVSSCIYPFTPDIPEADGRMVIEGDILAGEITTVRLSYVQNVDGTSATGKHSPFGDVWVEDENGKIIKGTYDELDEKKRTTYYVDTRDIDEGLKYRLHVRNLDNGREYVSLWTPVYDAGVIDGTGYNVDKENGKLECLLSLHSDTGVQNFRISYKEVWEYMSYYHTKYIYIRPQNVTYNEAGDPVDEGRIEESLTDHFYCWSQEKSTDVVLAGTDNLFTDRLKDFVFHKVDRTSRKISYVYSVDVNVCGLSGEALAYWKNIYTNSNISGSLFSPVPSEMVGNIRCVTDTTEVVMGYISATRRVSARMFYYNSDERFYQDIRPSFRMLPRDLDADEPMPNMIELDDLDYAPFDIVDDEPYWVPKRCIDCRLEGGTQTKPDYWPNND